MRDRKQAQSDKYITRLSNKKNSGEHEAFRVTEEFFRNVVDSLEDYAIFTTDTKGSVSSWNAGAERMLGYTEKEIIGINATIFFTKEDQKKKAPEEELKNAATKRTAFNERYHVRKDGTLFWGSGQVFPLIDEGGTLRGFTKIMRDRTDEQLVERRLSQLAAIVESSHDAIISRDLQGKILTWNNGAEKLFGYTSDEVIGKHITLTIPPHLQEEVVSEKTLTNLKKEKLTFDTVRKKKDGSHIAVSVTVSPLKNNKGKITGVSIIARDITTRKKMDETLSEMAAIVASSDDAIIRRTFDGIITHWNQGAMNLYGYTAREAIGKHISMLVPKEKTPDIDHIHQQLAKGEHIKHFETVRVRKDKTLIDVSISLSPVVDATGKVIAISTIGRDITERKTIERYKDEFLGIASHELKTPVTSIKAYTQLLHKRFIQGEDGGSAELVRKMDQQLTKLNDLISDLLDVTKIERGKIQFGNAYFDINELIHEISEEMQRTTETHTFKKELTKTKTIFGDRNRVGQVIANLLSNAVKYSPKAKEVLIKSFEERNIITVCVTDHGVGIPKEKKDFVFDRFYRVRGAKEDTFPGLGLGLYISKQIIERQGGKIWVEKSSKYGTTFCFTLPTGKKKSTKNKND